MVIFIREIVGCFTDVHTEDVGASGVVGKRNVNSLVEAPTHRLVERVRRVGRREHYAVARRAPDALHLA